MQIMCHTSTAQENPLYFKSYRNYLSVAFCRLNSIPQANLLEIVSLARVGFTDLSKHSNPISYTYLITGDKKKAMITYYRV